MSGIKRIMVGAITEQKTKGNALKSALDSALTKQSQANSASAAKAKQPIKKGAMGK